MRAEPAIRRGDPLVWLLGAMLVLYFAQVLGELFFHVDQVARYLSLSSEGLLAYRAWGVVTYAFVHGGPFHLIINMMMILLIGRPVGEMIGRQRLVSLLFASALGGALFFSVVHIPLGPFSLVGASAIAMGILTVYCLVQPDRPITFLILFVLPMTVRPRRLLQAMALVEVILLTAEVLGRNGGVASSAHLGGMLAAWLYHRKAIAGLPILPFPARIRALPRKAKAPSPARFTVNISGGAAFKAEVDRILDKINARGFGSLSDEEKAVLDRARDILGR